MHLLSYSATRRQRKVVYVVVVVVAVVVVVVVAGGDIPCDDMQVPLVTCKAVVS